MPRRRQLRPVLLIAACGTLLAGCALLGSVRFERPTVDLTGIRVTGLGLSGGSIVLVVDVYNPNGYEIRGLELVADLTLEDTHFGDARLSRETVLPAEGHAQIEVPMRFSWDGVGAAARGLLTRGSVAYRLGGRILVDTPVGDQWVDVRQSGMVSIGDVM
jgi:LEA14-like dessication related protein